MDYIDGIPVLQTGDPLSLVPEYTQELRQYLVELQSIAYSGSEAFTPLNETEVGSAGVRALVSVYSNGWRRVTFEAALVATINLGYNVPIGAVPQALRPNARAFLSLQYGNTQTGRATVSNDGDVAITWVSSSSTRGSTYLAGTYLIAP